MAGYRTLIATLRKLRRDAREGSVTIGDVLDSLGESAFCLLALFLALPMLQPFVPLGPYSVGGGFSFIVLGYQLLRGFPEPILPGFVRRVPVANRILDLIAGQSIRFLGWCRRHTRVRRLHWVSGNLGRRMSGGILLGSGCIMIIPFFGIPLNDFFPALAIVSVSLGELEQDGLLVLVALFWLAVSAIYCTFLISMIVLFGWQVFGIVF